MYFLSHRTLPVKHFGTAAFHDEEVQSAVPVFLFNIDNSYHA